MFECCVCLENLQDENNKVIPCLHKLCTECYQKMIENRLYVCPICRTNFSVEERINRVYQTIENTHYSLYLSGYEFEGEYIEDYNYESDDTDTTNSDYDYPEEESDDEEEDIDSP